MGGKNELGDIWTSCAAVRRIRFRDHLREMHARQLLPKTQEAVTDTKGE